MRITLRAAAAGFVVAGLAACSGSQSGVAPSASGAGALASNPRISGPAGNSLRTYRRTTGSSIGYDAKKGAYLRNELLEQRR